MAYVKKCPLCGANLEIDDIDNNFYGNQDEYSKCPICLYDFIFYIRYGKLWKYIKTKLIYDNDLDYFVADDENSETIIVNRNLR